MNARRGIMFGCCTAFLLGGCGGGGETETVIERQTVIERAPEPRERERVPNRPPRPPRDPAPAPEPPPEPAGGTVPDVVGQNHQLAQDTMQAAGFFVLDEQDSTGQNRLLLYDRNWVVERQDPPGGSQASPDATITLFSKKQGE